MENVTISAQAKVGSGGELTRLVVVRMTASRAESGRSGCENVKISLLGASLSPGSAGRRTSTWGFSQITCPRRSRLGQLPGDDMLVSE
jgi:hypothetical protein